MPIISPENRLNDISDPSTQSENARRFDLKELNPNILKE